ncbi:Glutathione S-transferase omega-like 2, partial [Lachnellula cervina]
RKSDFYPEHLRKEINDVGQWMQADLNTRVYKAGFAPDQQTYDTNVISVFRALNRLEEILSKNHRPYILGSEITELDIRLFPTLIRFNTHFKCNLGTICYDYPLLNEWMKNLYWNVPGFKETTDFKHIKENISYTKSHGDINPKAITPMGPILDIEAGVDKDWSKIKAGGVKLPV